jgi:hypothetical protein
MSALYITSQAHIVASGLNSTDLDGWTYAVEDNENGTAYIRVSDDAGEFVDYLGIHLVAEHQEGITQPRRITGGGVVITRH